MPLSSTTGDQPDDSVPVPRHGTSSVVSGGTAGAIVQAREVSGGLHFHQAPAPPGAPRGTVPRQLPADIRRFVNRTRELERLDGALLGADPAPLAVVVGTAGVGKTALALRWAYRAEAAFPDGQLYVNLRGYDPGAPVTADDALDRFLRALDVPPGEIPADLEARAALYRTRLADRRVLVVLDNATQVSQVRTLLPGSRTCRTVVTSRDRLEGLLARDSAYRMTLDVLPEDEAVRLISTLVADYRTRDDPNDIAQLAELCARLPLALCIAAERAASRPWLPLDQLIQNLRDEPGALWEALSAESGDEQDDVRTVFAWSYRAMPKETARMFRLLGLHPGPEFGVQVAAELAAVPVPEARQLLDSIVGMHMVEQIAPDRYQFHDLLRAYATDAAHHEEPLTRQYEAVTRALAWYLHTVRAAGNALRESGESPPPTALPAPASATSFGDRTSAAHWFDLEWPNLRAAIRSAEKCGLHGATWQLALASRPGIRQRGVSAADRHAVLASARDAAREDRELARRARDTERAAQAQRAEGEALVNLGSTYTHEWRMDEASAAYAEALALFHEIADPAGERMARTSLGVALALRRRFAAAAEQFEDLVAVHRREGARRKEAVALSNLAECYDALGRHDEATARARRSLALNRETGQRGPEIVSLVYLGRSLAHAGPPGSEEGTRDASALGAALREIATAVEVARSLDNKRLEGWALLDLGEIQCRAGRFEDALVSYQRATVIHTAQDMRGRLGQSLCGTGEAYLGLGRPGDAVAFHRRAVALARTGGSPWQLAVALDRLAGAVEASGEDGSAATDWWREAAEALTVYGDPEAAALRARIERRL